MSLFRKDILFIQTGGTIDKEYPKTIGGYHFEIGEPAVKRIVDKVKPSVGFEYTVCSVCRKDSQEITELDREAMAVCVLNAIQSKIIVTHGTDTIIETAKFVQHYLKSNLKNAHKDIIFVGSFLPERFKDSDADINIGTALGALEILQLGRVSETGKVKNNVNVCIALGGRVIPAARAVRNPVTGLFCESGEVNFPG